MTSNTAKVITNIGMLIFNFAIIAGTAYLVFWKGASGWWFVLTVLLSVYTKDKDDE